MQHNKNVDQLSVRSKQNKKSYFNKKKERAREVACMSSLILHLFWQIKLDLYSICLFPVKNQMFLFLSMIWPMCHNYRINRYSCRQKFFINFKEKLDESHTRVFQSI